MARPKKQFKNPENMPVFAGQILKNADLVKQDQILQDSAGNLKITAVKILINVKPQLVSPADQGGLVISVILLLNVADTDVAGRAIVANAPG